MGDYTDKLRKGAGEALEEGESLLAGVRGMSAGSTAQIIGSVTGAVTGGGVGLVAADAVTRAGRAEGRAAEAEAGLDELPPQIALGLTDRRLLIFARGGLTGRAKDLVAFLPREAIAALDAEKSGSALSPDRLTVTLTDDSEVTFEIVKKDDVDRMVTAFESSRDD